MITIDEVRALEFAIDKVDVSDSVVALDSATLSALENVVVSGEVALDSATLAALENVVVSGTVEIGATSLAALENVTVSATNLDIRDLAFATDKVDVSDSVVALDATTLAALENVTVSATNLDIRDLAFATDKVDVSDSVVALDAATLAALETVTVVEGAFNSWKSTAASVTSTAGQLVATSLTGRLSITIQNLGTADIYIGASNAVTTATGTKIAKGSQFSEKLGASATIWAITASGTADVRISEFAS